MNKKLYCLCLVMVMSISGCMFKSLAPQALPDRGLEVPPNTLCCVPDENAPLTSCGGWTLCEFDSQGELI